MDLGEVLERVGDSAWPTRWAERWAGEAGLDADGVALALSEDRVEAMMAEMWDGYCGELDVALHDYWLSLRDRGLLLGILSNSMDGARREEGRRYGFPDQADVLVYSHEVGLAKPDPAIYELTTKRLGVRPEEIAFLDDQPGNVAAARDHGWHALVHEDTGRSIAWLRDLVERSA